MSSFEILLDKAKKFHSEACPGIVMGTRMTLTALKELGLNPENPGNDLIVYVEIDRCATDAIQAITGCSLGHRTLKHMNFGKFAATFQNTATGKAVRVVAIPKDKVNGGETDFKKIGEMLKTIPDDKIFTITEVEMTIPPEDLPGFPQYKAICSKCGEEIMDKKEIVTDEGPICKNCGGQSYYRVK